ncbi:hypothetical protein BJ170DRAFT_606081 [Xylariales sp. AK1849]|nr:hypothetical protein BJ170DRAFT_606081 [Xylariales sp. AK1849]
MTQTLLKSLGISAVVALLALTTPFLYHFLATSYASSLRDTIFGAFARHREDGALPFICQPHMYTTEIISLNPLLIYISSFISASEVSALLKAGEPEFRPSGVVKRGHQQRTTDRTSQSAGLPPDNAAVRCVLSRAEQFMGTMLDPVRDDIGPPQLVRYTAGQRFNIHHDWYERPQPARRDKVAKGRSWNRVASFFAVLQDGCTGGETHFPYVKAVAPRRRGVEEEGAGRTWWEHQDGGITFRPVSGNAVFWVNLHANGTGDDRVAHSGLPLGEGLKTAMNIWPRQYYP